MLKASCCCKWSGGAEMRLIQGLPGGMERSGVPNKAYRLAGWTGSEAWCILVLINVLFGKRLSMLKYWSWKTKPAAEIMEGSMAGGGGWVELRLRRLKDKRWGSLGSRRVGDLLLKWTWPVMIFLETRKNWSQRTCSWKKDYSIESDAGCW